MNGSERLVWQENADGFVFLSSYQSPLKPGFARRSTTTPSEMDRIFSKINAQERERHARMTKQLFDQDKEFMESNLANLRTRLANSPNQMEKDVIRLWIQAFNNKMDRLMKNNIYGISSMQETEANPKAAGENPVHFIPSEIVN